VQSKSADLGGITFFKSLLKIRLEHAIIYFVTLSIFLGMKFSRGIAETAYLADDFCAGRSIGFFCLSKGGY